MDDRTIEVRRAMGLPIPARKRKRTKPRFDRAMRADIRADRMFHEGVTARPHSRRGTSNDPTDFKRAFVTAAPGSGKVVHRDRRHPDLKRPKAIRTNNDIRTTVGINPGKNKDTKPSFYKSGGFPNTVTSKHADGVCDAPKA
jgi:hypothetical protein